MSRLFIDTEFNSFGGELISMALVSDDGREWYQIMRTDGMSVDLWVESYVVPYLYHVDPPSAYVVGTADNLASSLKNFLSDFQYLEIIADWPADFEHLCALLSTIGARGGFKEAFPCTMRLINTPELKPEVPHNALSDARALRDWYLALKPETGTQNDLGAK